MGHVQRMINGVLVELRETADGRFNAWCNGCRVVQLSFTRDGGHGRWVCPCGTYESGKRDPMLTHVVDEHVRAVRHSLEARSTNPRLSGKHPDPTYDEAMFHMYGNPW